MTAILVVAGLTLLASFLCSLFEAALYSITPSQIELLKKQEVRGAERLAGLRADVEEPIAAILTINTVAHTVGAASLGAMVADHFSEYAYAVAVFSAVFTILVLAVTEIVPKSIGVRYARTLGPHVAFPIQVMTWFSYPISRPSRAIMRMLTGGGEADGPTEDEVVLVSKMAESSGEVRADEHRWVRNALRLDQVTAADLRTPRTVVFALPADATVGESTNAEGWTHSRVPVAEEGDLDRIVGVVYRRDVFEAALRGEHDKTMRDIMHPLEFVPETTAAHALLERFITERRHMLAVADEYGGFEGVVTLEDVMEQLLGQEIVDEHDIHEDMQQAARDRGSAPN